ncbi:MAG: transposase [Actinobacteria bacterium]|nr:transposase [Actinomycetota bacterium]MBU4483506.1 transposase [Actinomycetota bacterium]MCG2791243.1 transposase [Actinomycetes bacterium]
MFDKYIYINYNRNMQSYKFRLQPNKEQREKLDNMFGCSRFTWNYFLDLNNKIYLEAKEKDLKKKHLNYYDCANKLTGLKKENEWLKEANSQALQQTLKDLDTAYNRFFQKKSGFPKFKSKKNNQSFRVPQFFELKGNHSCFPKFKKGIKTIIHREVLGNVKYATISKTKTDKYFVSITTDFEEKKKRISNNSAGLDLGIKDLVVVSDGQKYSLKINEGNIKFLHKQISKKKKGSKNRKKAILKLAKRYEKFGNVKQDFQHKLSDKLCKENKLIAIEDLNIKGMLKNHCLAKSISNQSWYWLIKKIEYKSKRYGGEVVKTKRFYPSSKTCNHCGYINQDLELKDREWECPKCKTILDRDINASKNILAQVLRELNLKGEGSTRLKPAELSSIDEAVKQEAFGSLVQR